jgi:hypothetical protein
MLVFEKVLTLYIIAQEATQQAYDAWVERFARFTPDGFTVTDGHGGWLGKSGFVIEPVKLFTVWNPTDEQIEGLFETFDKLRKDEGQEAVSVEINGKPYVCFTGADIQEAKALALA